MLLLELRYWSPIAYSKMSYIVLTTCFKGKYGNRLREFSNTSYVVFGAEIVKTQFPNMTWTAIIIKLVFLRDFESSHQRFQPSETKNVSFYKFSWFWYLRGVCSFLSQNWWHFSSTRHIFRSIAITFGLIVKSTTNITGLEFLLNNSV